MEVKKASGSAGLGSLEDLFPFNMPSAQPTDLGELQTGGPQPTLEIESSLIDDNNASPPNPPLEKEETTSEKQEVSTEEEAEKYRQILRNIFGKRVDKVTTEDENGSEIEVPLEEVEMDAQTFEAIALQAMEAIQEEAGVDTISTKGIPESTLKVLGIVKDGGDIDVLFNLKVTVLDPLDALDLTKREDQIKVLFMRQRAQNLPDEDTQVLIAGYEANGILEEKATLADSQLRAAVQAKFDQYSNQALQKKAESEDAAKKFKKEFKDNLGVFQLNETSKNKLIDFVFKKAPGAKLDPMDEAYYAAKENPAVAVQLALWLRDKEEYDNQISDGKVKASQLERAGKIRILRKSDAHDQPQNNPRPQSNSGSLDELV